MSLLSRLLSARRLRFLRRSPAVWWTAAAVLATVTAGTAHSIVSDAEDARTRFGVMARVPVAARAVAAGTVVEAPDVEWRDLPAALLPKAQAATSPAGRVALVDIVAGEVFVRERLAPWGLRGVAALLPPEHQAVALPLPDTGRPPLRPGDRVDVLVTFPPEVADDPTFPVARGALVLDAGRDVVTVAVVAALVADVVYAVTAGTVAVAVTAA